MMPVFNSTAPSSIQLVDAIGHMLADAGNHAGYEDVVIELARNIARTPSDQVFRLVAELDAEWVYRPAETLAGAENPATPDLYHLATSAIQTNELAVEQVETNRILAAIPYVVTARRVEVLVASINQESLPLLVAGAQLIRKSGQSFDHLECQTGNWQTGKPNHEPLQTMAALIEAISTVESADSFPDAVQRAADFIAELVNENSEEPNSTEVHIGISTNTSGHDTSPVWTACSGGQKPDTETINRIEAAMSETKARQQPSRWPIENETGATSSSTNRFAALCLKSLASSSEQSHFYSFELTEPSGQSIGVVVVAAQTPFLTKTLSSFDALAMPIGSALNVVRRAELNHVGKLIRAVTDRWEKQKTKTIAQIALAILAFALIPFPYSVPSKSELQPGIRRFVSVPFDAKLADCSIEPGDWVEQDQELARLDEQEVRLELAQVEAELYRAMKDRDGRVARHESGEAALAKLKADALAARQQLLRYRCDNLVLKSPIEGMVVAGDFKDAEGMPLSTGDSMFEIAKMESLRLEIFIPADDIHLVQEGASVNVRFDALPFESFSLTIERLNPAAELRDGSNVFVATAVMPNPNFRLRPGMQGSAQVRSAWMPISWHYLRKPVGHTLRWLGW